MVLRASQGRAPSPPSQLRISSPKGSPVPIGPGDHQSAFCPWVVPILTFHANSITQYVVFSVRLLSAMFQLGSIPLERGLARILPWPGDDTTLWMSHTSCLVHRLLDGGVWGTLSPYAWMGVGVGAGGAPGLSPCLCLGLCLCEGGWPQGLATRADRVSSCLAASLSSWSV